jgi:signal transduction histidine kinase
VRSRRDKPTRLARLRWGAFGLRGRILGLVVVSTVATLLVAAAVLLPRLESSLRNAAETTLRADLHTAARQHRLQAFDHLDYLRLAVLAERSLEAHGRRSGSTLKAFAGAESVLRADENDLGTTLGTDYVFLYGYLDASGHGELIGLTRPVPADDGPGASTSIEALPGPTSASSGLERAGLSEISSAFLRDRTSIGFVSLDDEQYIRAAIPVRSDDAVIVAYKPVDYIPAAVSVVRRAFVIAGIAGLLLTVILAIPLAATLVRRLRALREAALRVAVQGTAAEFPLDRARDEVGDLARSFAIMQRRLRHQEEARRAFVATASHELRTPLASLDGMLELLADDLTLQPLDLDDARDLLERARRQSRRLGRLAADLLDLSRIDADVELRSEPLELAELARAVLAEFELALSAKGLSGALHNDGGPVWALGDPGSVARILRILIDNALRVAPPGSEISVSLTDEPAPTLTVSDCGPGIAPEERELIFERFQRGRDTGGQAGFGLGLAIGRELAERMGGSLSLRETGAPGATFALTLPPARAPVRDPLTSSAEQRP